MIQKCSLLNVLGAFFKEPTTIHFIREISRKIDLAPTSVRNNLKGLKKMKLIIEKESKPFDGFIANRDNEKFLFYKRIYNLYTLYELKEKIIEEMHPKSIILFGSYSLGEDIENSDIDLLIISNIKKEFDLKKFEEILKRRITIIIVNSLNKLDKQIKKKIYNGFILYGSL